MPACLRGTARHYLSILMKMPLIGGWEPPNAVQEYDVYAAAEPPRLEEGVRKHTLSVFVADESGLINRVAGVFARRGGWCREAA